MGRHSAYRPAGVREPQGTQAAARGGFVLPQEACLAAALGIQGSAGDSRAAVLAERPSRLRCAGFVRRCDSKSAQHRRVALRSPRHDVADELIVCGSCTWCRSFTRFAHAPFVVVNYDCLMQRAAPGARRERRARSRSRPRDEAERFVAEFLNRRCGTTSFSLDDLEDDTPRRASDEDRVRAALRACARPARPGRDFWPSWRELEVQVAALIPAAETSRERRFSSSARYRAPSERPRVPGRLETRSLGRRTSNLVIKS